MRPDFFKRWRIQSAIAASRDHSLDTTAPLLDQLQFLKYSTDDAVAKFGNPFLDVFNSEAEGKQARVLNFQAIVKQGDADWSARLSVVGMNNRVHDSLADSDVWKSPEIGSLHGSNDCFASHVLPQEGNHFLRGSRK